VFLGVMAIVATIATAKAAEPGSSELKIGLPGPMFKDVPKAMVNAAATPFQNMIQDKSGLKGSVKVLPDYTSLADEIAAGRIDIGVFHGFEYAWVKDMPDLVPLVVTVPNCGKVQACLVVHADSKVTDAKDLKGACVLVPKMTKAHCHMYLERLRDKIPAGDCCPAKSGSLTPHETLIEVANERADAALVDISALLSLQRELPAAFKQLRVLKQSELLPSAVVVYRKGALDAKTIDKIRNGLIDCVNSPMGKLFAMFWQLKGFENVTPEYHAQVANSLKVYPAPVQPVVPEPLPKK
jgi:ABC-type phosphate/phosphonate transport system substrate-binding protein